MVMSLNEINYSLDVKKDNHISNLVNDLCAMTECDQEQAFMQLSICDFDFESAANKILESSSAIKQTDSDWQIINRQKKIKKKQEKVEVEQSSDSFRKNDSNWHPKFKAQSQKTDHFKNEEKLNNNRAHRNRRNRINARKPKESVEDHIPNNLDLVEAPFVISDSENELRWDNIGDIDGAFKESSNNSQADGFYSENDFGPSAVRLDDNSYSGVSTQLVSDIQQRHKTNSGATQTVTSTEKPSREQSYSSLPESEVITECLTHQLPIFGKFSQTESPQTIPIVPDQPVSFFRQMKPKKMTTIKHYNFGINLKEELAFGHQSQPKYRIPNDHQASQMTHTSEQSSKMFVNRNPMIPSNEPNNNQSFHPPGIMNDIIHAMFQNQKALAMLMANNAPQNYYDLSKPMNMISIPNSNHAEQIYKLNLRPFSLHPNIENGINIQSHDGFGSQSTFPASNNMSVPFHANRK